MEQTPDFLKKNSEIGIDANDMNTLEELITAYDEANKAVNIAETKLKEAKARFNALALDRIPEFLLTHGIRKMSLNDGREVVIKEDISATVKDDIAFRQWLRERNEDAIIKVKYIFGRIDTSKLVTLSNYLIDQDLDFEVDESIHAQTKKKYFKELIKEMNRTELPDWVTIYDIRKAVIK